MIKYARGINRLCLATLVAGCMDNFKPYMPNDWDDSFWVVDGTNDWKVQFFSENRMKIWHRYSDTTAEKALETWIAYRTGGDLV